MFVGMLMRAQFRCSLEQLGIAASRRGGRRHRGRRGCARRRDCPRLAKSEDARAVLRGPGLPGPFPVQLRELAPLQYQLIKSVQTLVKPLAGNRAGRLHPDARAPRHPRQFQYAQVLFQFAHLFGTCGHRFNLHISSNNQPGVAIFLSFAVSGLSGFSLASIDLVLVTRRSISFVYCAMICLCNN